MNFQVTFLGRSLLAWQSYAHEYDRSSKVMLLLTGSFVCVVGSLVCVHFCSSTENPHWSFLTVGAGPQSSALTAVHLLTLGPQGFQFPF